MEPSFLLQLSAADPRAFLGLSWREKLHGDGRVCNQVICIAALRFC